MKRKLCFLNGDSVGRRYNNKYVSGYLPEFENMESEQYCSIIGRQDSLRAATCDVPPPCEDKKCEFGFKRDENHCQVSCDCVEDDKRFLLDDIIIRKEEKPFVMKKYQVNIVDCRSLVIYFYFKRSGGAQACINRWDNIRQDNKYIVPYTIPESLRPVFKHFSTKIP